MKLARFTAGNLDEIGVVEGDRVISISRSTPKLAGTMRDLIARWPVVESEVRRIAAEARETVALSEVRLLAPIARPGKIFAIGLNYADHIAETKMEKPTQQVWFTKAGTAVNGPFDPVQIPKISQFVDYEVELVAVIGSGGKHISRAAAPGAVFGFCVGNDVTERLWQNQTAQWCLGKSFDTHAPFGPWITTSDEITNPHALGIRCFVNGEKRQDSNTKHLIFDVWAQIEHLSQAMTLEPGDVIFTGTPNGVGAAMDPRQFLKAGDRVRCEIDGLGAIETVCADEV